MFDWRALCITFGVLIILFDLGSSNSFRDLVNDFRSNFMWNFTPSTPVRDTSIVRSQLAPQFAYDLSSNVPRLIWTIITIVGLVSLLGVLLSMKAPLSSLLKLRVGGGGSSSAADDYFPDYLVFCSNHTTMEKLAALTDETTKAEMRQLFKSEDWRMHLRSRGRDESGYNWQLREAQQQNLLEESSSSDID